jgi:hypothetical protein
MQVSVLPEATELREAVARKKSEGHTLGLRLLIRSKDALPEPKLATLSGIRSRWPTP